jgi:D-tyrosyl-tRNA(Tyr) deacylase
MYKKWKVGTILYCKSHFNFCHSSLVNSKILYQLVCLYNNYVFCQYVFKTEIFVQIRISHFKSMRVVIQRVTKASVTVEGQVTGRIDKGLLILVGIEDADTEEDIVWLSNKMANLRIFNDEEGVMNRSVMEVDGNILLVSQFTLHAATKKGNRPSYIKASKPDIAIPMYEKLKQQLAKDIGKPVATGIFGADMKVELLNDGPVTIIIDTKNKE